MWRIITNLIVRSINAHVTMQLVILHDMTYTHFNYNLTSVTENSLKMHVIRFPVYIYIYIYIFTRNPYGALRFEWAFATFHFRERQEVDGFRYFLDAWLGKWG